MEQMKVSSAIRAYPNKFLLLQAVKRNDSGTVEIANVVGICDVKEQAFVQYEVLRMIGVKCFIVPTFDTDDEDIHENKEQDITQSLLTPSEHARIFRQYYNLD